MDELYSAAAKMRPCVVADPFNDPDDGEVFAVVYAIQVVRMIEPWLVRGVLRRSRLGPPMLRRVAVEPFLVDPPWEVTGEVVRSLNFASIRNEALTRLSALTTVHAITSKTSGVSAWSSQQIEAVERAAANPPKASGPSRGYPIDHFRRIAIRYLELVAEGRRDVAKALAEEEGIKRETARGWLRKATTLGMLGPGRPGHAGREPGPNLYRTEEKDDG
jgi:hypothetical protein